MQSQGDITKAKDKQPEDQINRIKIKEVLSFEGPCMKYVSL